MKNISLWCIIFLASISTAFSQSCPPNIDFEKGDFSNWECFIGDTKELNGKNIIDLKQSSPLNGRHEIISATNSGKDKYGNFPQLCPYGGNYSVKLGNDDTHSEAEGLSYTFDVPTAVDTFTFTYFYAVVFQDPDHLVYQQPRFFVTAYDVVSGSLINCASFDYVSNGAIPGFEVSEGNSGVLFKNWTPASLQFAGLAGRSVRLEFKTADCTLGGHFGYAYVDVGSACSNILATAPYCAETNSLLLNAPYGFRTYTWYNQDYSAIVGTGQSVTFSPPPAVAGVFNVDVIPYPGYGCRDTLQAVVVPLPVPPKPEADSVYTGCQYGNNVQLNLKTLPGHELVWYASANAGTGTTTTPKPNVLVAGSTDYYVAQKVMFGCESFRRKLNVIIQPTPTASFTVNTNRQCEKGNEFIFTSSSTNTFKTVYNWTLGNGTTISSAADSIVKHTFTTAGNLTVRLEAVNANVCSSQRSQMITVVPKPVASFTYPAAICENQTMVSFVNTSSVPGQVAAINKWFWSVKDQISTTQQPPAFIQTDLTPVKASLVVTTTEGCISDTTIVVLPVRSRPVSSFTYGKLLCDNELISFANTSKMTKGGSAEQVVKWNWQFANFAGSVQQHPTLNLPAGYHRVKLVSESNFGCKSPEVDSMVLIHAKPRIQLNINDSCVFREIRYAGVDLLNTVDKWYWNFGNGNTRSTSFVSQVYKVEGYRPLTLIAETIHGCKDTVTRPFTIYDNKAFAGRDTLVANGQPLYLNAHGGTGNTYVWSPSLGLNNAAIENPVATLDHDQTYKLDALTDKGCDSHSKILIKRYKGPELYIPTAFTPNGDHLNEVLKVFPVGIKSFGFFAVYNRYGQRVFYTQDVTKGWDGRFNGIPCETGNYPAYSEAIDYNGNKMFKKINVLLMR